MKSVLTWIVIIVIVILGIMWWNNSSSVTPVDTTTTQTTTNTTTGTTPAPTQSGTSVGVTTQVTVPPVETIVPTASVTIQNFAFSPQTLMVKKGTSVTWTNKDTMAHTVTVTGGSGPSSASLATGATFSFTFDTVGTFAYKCSIHPTMQGTIVVTE